MDITIKLDDRDQEQILRDACELADQFCYWKAGRDVTGRSAIPLLFDPLVRLEERTRLLPYRKVRPDR